MTKKDYIRIAQILKDQRVVPNADPLEAIVVDNTIDSVSVEFARMLAQDNGNFDRERFLDACGVA